MWKRLESSKTYVNFLKTSNVHKCSSAMSEDRFISRINKIYRSKKKVTLPKPINVRDELNNKTVLELKQLCRDKKISGFSGKTKGEIINMIVNSA